MRIPVNTVTTLRYLSVHGAGLSEYLFRSEHRNGWYGGYLEDYLHIAGRDAASAGIVFLTWSRL